MLKYIWITLLLGAACVTALYPEIDVLIAQQFYSDDSFALSTKPLPEFIHFLAVDGARALGVGLIIWLLLALIQKKNWRRPAFLLAILIIGAGLIANIGLKDNWGRARPSQTTQFGGTAEFTPWFKPTNQCDNNCSFVAGDGAFGFIFPALAFVYRRRRLCFWSGIAIGIIMGGNRIIMGAHFFSDVVFSSLTMLGTMALLACLFSGTRQAKEIWRSI